MKIEFDVYLIGSTISPDKKPVLSGQYLKQLDTIQKLKDDCVLSTTEFNNQKERILNNLKSLD